MNARFQQYTVACQDTFEHFVQLTHSHTHGVLILQTVKMYL